MTREGSFLPSAKWIKRGTWIFTHAFFKTLVQFVLLFWNCKATLRMAQELRFSIGANIIIWLSVMNGKKKTLFFQSYLSTLTCITYQSCVYYTFRFYACVSGDSWWNNLCDYCNIYVHLRLSIQDCSQSQWQQQLKNEKRWVWTDPRGRSEQLQFEFNWDEQ